MTVSVLSGARSVQLLRTKLQDKRHTPSCLTSSVLSPTSLLTAPAHVFASRRRGGLTTITSNTIGLRHESRYECDPHSLILARVTVSGPEIDSVNGIPPGVDGRGYVQFVAGSEPARAGRSTWNVAYACEAALEEGAGIARIPNVVGPLESCRRASRQNLRMSKKISYSTRDREDFVPDILILKEPH